MALRLTEWGEWVAGDILTEYGEVVFGPVTEFGDFTFEPTTGPTPPGPGPGTRRGVSWGRGRIPKILPVEG